MGRRVDFVFQGSSALALDGKGRMTVPARHREPLAALSGNELTITKHPQRCLMLFPRPAWIEFRSKILATTMAGDPYRRLFVGGAADVELDAGSRVLIAPELRDWAGLGRDVMLLGMGSRFEIWDRARLQAHEDSLLEAPLPPAIADLVL